MADIQSIEYRIRKFYITLSRPVQYCSLFYSYYYLCEIKNHKELMPFFNELIDNLYQSFFDYGIYSVIRELTHLYNKFYYATPSDFFKANETIKPTKQMIDIMNFYMLSDRSRLGYPYITVKSMCIEAEEKLHAFTKPIPFLQSSERIFELENWWEEDYGGYSWARIAKILYSIKSTTPIIFIDSCWNLEHNTSYWLNKLYTAEDERKLDVIELSQLLDENYVGELKNIYKTAALYHQFLVDYKGDFYD